MSLPQRAVAIVILLSSSPSYAAGAPEQLKGKSIVVTWAETRQQKNEGWSDFRTVEARHKLIIYVSTKGRVFSRQTNTTRAGSGNIDQVAG
jgi:hypothetical protein